MRAVIYDRVSVKDESSQAEHVRRCRAYVAAQGDWEVVGEPIVDTASGYRRDVVRPGWEEVRRMVATGGVDAVVVFAVSRAGRNAARLFQFVEECRDANVVFASATEPISTGGQYGSVFVAILGAIAEMESATKRERALVGRAVAARDGTWTGGRRPYGFAAVKVRPGDKTSPTHLVVDPEEAEHVRMAAEAVLNGSSLNSAAEAMNRAGARTVPGGLWHSADLGALLERPENAPDILTARQLTRVQRAVAVRRLGPRRPRYLLTGLLFCGKCGGKMKGKPTGDERKYVCTATGKLHLSILTSIADEEVGLACSNMVIADPEAVTDPGDIPGELAAELREIEERLEKLGEQVETGELSEAAFRGRERKLSERATEIEGRIEEAASGGPRFAALLEDPGEVPDSEMRLWVESLVEKVEIMPGRGTGRIRVRARPGVVPVGRQR